MCDDVATLILKVRVWSSNKYMRHIFYLCHFNIHCCFLYGYDEYHVDIKIRLEDHKNVEHKGKGFQ